nr:pentapeptide repeat-containing protein [Clostridioides mangenotii]
MAVENSNLTSSVFSGTKLKNVDFTSSNIEGMDVLLKDVEGAIFTPLQALEISRLLRIIIR